MELMSRPGECGECFPADLSSLVGVYGMQWRGLGAEGAGDGISAGRMAHAEAQQLCGTRPAQGDHRRPV